MHHGLYTGMFTPCTMGRTTVDIPHGSWAVQWYIQPMDLHGSWVVQWYTLWNVHASWNVQHLVFNHTSPALNCIGPALNPTLNKM